MDEFIQELLKKAGFEEGQEIEFLKEDIRPVLIDRIVTELASKLTEEQRENVTNMLKENHQIDDIVNYLKTFVDDYEDFLQKIYEKFEKEYLDQMQ